MKISPYFLGFCLLLSFVTVAQQKQYKVNTIAFYNVENLFDYEDDPLIFDDDRTPEGKDHWTKEIYEAKLANMAKVISEIGADVTGTSPALIGVSEVENRRGRKIHPGDTISYDGKDIYVIG